MIRIYVCKDTKAHKWAKCGEVLDFNPNAMKPKLDKPPSCSVCHKYMELLTK